MYQKIKDLLKLHLIDVREGKGSYVYNMKQLYELRNDFVDWTNDFNSELVKDTLKLFGYKPTTREENVKLYRKIIKLLAPSATSFIRRLGHLRRYGVGSHMANLSTYYYYLKLPKAKKPIDLNLGELFKVEAKHEDIPTIHTIKFILEVSDEQIERTNHIKSTNAELEKNVNDVFMSKYVHFADLVTWEEIDADGKITNKRNINSELYEQMPARRNAFDQRMKDILGQELYNNETSTCVTRFAEKYGLNPKKYRNGMRLETFVKHAYKDGFNIYSNQLTTYHSEHKNPRASILAYNGHVYDINIEDLKTEKFRKNCILESSEFEQKFIDTLHSPNEVVYDIKVYSGVYGKFLYSFSIYNDKHIYNRLMYEKGMTPSAVIKNILKPYTSPFVNNLVKNLPIFSGKAPEGSYGYDLTAAYITAFKNIKEIPDISNFRIHKDRVVKIDSDNRNWVVRTKPFHYRGTYISPTIMLLTEAIEFGAPFKWCYYIKRSIQVNAMDLYNEIVESLTEYKEFMSNIKESNHFHIEPIRKNKVIVEGEKYVHQCMRLAFGSMISDPHNSDVKYVGYLENIVKSKYKGMIIKPSDYVPFKTKFYHNIYFAMSVQYRKLMKPMLDLNPICVNVDCVYFTVPPPCEICEPWHDAGILEKSKCYDWMQSSRLPKIDHPIVVKGFAGSGKTYQYANEIKEHTEFNNLAPDLKPFYKDVVIIPQNRLSTTWGCKCYTFMYFLNKYNFPVAHQIYIDEAFQTDPSQVEKMVGFCLYNKFGVTLIGDPWQLRPIYDKSIYRENYIYAFTGCAYDKLMTKNYRNKINYRYILQHEDTEEFRREIFDKYLRKYLIDYDYTDIVYCYRTGMSGKSVSTRRKHEDAYRKYVYENGITDYFMRCTGNVKINGVEYYNGVIYKVNTDMLENHKYFTVSNVYSIYTTQGQTMQNIKLLRDDEKYYYKDKSMLYVLISRIKEV